ncbi:sensor histidine kinase [Gemmatimonas phototrophica]|uniref:sensor histidine kinase n=1 Tax=Gemmatimonas phototrophica TaxID=1379270 RepID=UPI0006A6A222|nr:histidine kinase [Gemmatimonas phototrophica]
MTMRGALIYLVLWVPLVLVYAILIGAPNAMPINEAVIGALSTVGIASGLGVAALWWVRTLGRRVLDAQDANTTWSPRPAHVLGASLYTLIWSAYIVYDIRLAFGDWSTTVAQVRPWILWQLFFGIVVYATIASVTWAMQAGERTRQREARLRVAEAERARAELAVLRAQVDPHFLYNALHTATALVRRDPEAAEQALEQLAMLLRYVLDPTRGARETVPLDEELRFVELYLAIERARLGDRLQVVMEIDDDARDLMVPSLSLQPLVENAIRHGLAPRANGGSIVVRAEVHEQQMVLSVADNGLGMPSSPASGSSSTGGTGIGLDALRKRLAAKYGARASLQVTTAPGEGFSVRLLLPV